MSWTHWTRLLVFLAGCQMAAACWAAPRVAITDPAKADEDFAIQGEYAGELKTADGGKPVGVQVVALGEGKFDAVLLRGGLPGAGWDKSPREKASGQRDGQTATLKGSTWQGTIANGALTVSDAGGQTLGTLKKIERKSPTLGAKPPQGAVVLFDGTSTENFPGAKMTEDGHLMVEANSKQTFGDHKLHIEFRTPYMPNSRGQGRGNSGVYVQSRYEVQVLDSFGLEGKDNECGGIYSIAPPAVNMCLPPLSWQTYDIEFQAARYEGDKKVKNARITVKHNGVVIHDNLELSKGTPGRAGEGPQPLGLHLQNHGDPVVYRNIWVVEK